MHDAQIISSEGLELVEDKKNKELCDKVFKFFSTVPQGMTKFQIQNFVLCDREFPTADSKWWQAKLELFMRLQNVIQMHYDYRKRRARIKELKAKIKECEYRRATSTNQFEREIQEARAERLKIDIEENEFAMMLIKKTVRDKLKEMQAFWEMMQALEPHMKYSKENKDEQEAEFWHTKAKYIPELKMKFPEVFGASRRLYDQLVRKERKRIKGK